MVFLGTHQFILYMYVFSYKQFDKWAYSGHNLNVFRYRFCKQIIDEVAEIWYC